MYSPRFSDGAVVRIVKRIPHRFDEADRSPAEVGKTGIITFSKPLNDAEPTPMYCVRGTGIVREAWWPEDCLEDAE